MPRGGPALWLAILVVVALASALPRGVRGMRHTWSLCPAPPEGVEPGDFFSSDPDGQYHMRRVERALVEGEVAGRDPYLAFPDGSAIPWPPYYDRLLAWIAEPFAPEDAARRRHVVERLVATVPFACALVTSVVVAGAAGLLAGPLAALCAGLAHAFTDGAIMYGLLGGGDHHAWIALLLGLSLFGTSHAYARLTERAGALRRGVALGVVAGVALGSWVAALVHVLIVQAVLGWLLIVRARRPLPGLPAFGCAYHATALVVLLPAVLASPWTDAAPWMVVNLSWFHATLLALGALVFVPPLVSRSFDTGTRAARAWPWVVAGALALGFGMLVALDSGPGTGLREAFAWASRTNPFMDSVKESWPLVGAGAESSTALFEGLGWLSPLALVGWLLAAREAFVRGSDRWLPFVVAFPIFVVQALTQRRFADVLALPLAVLIGTALAHVTRSWQRGSLGRRALAWGLALVVPLVSFGPLRLVERVRIGYGSAEAFWGPPRTDYALGDRMLYEWLRAYSVAGHGSGVLAYWDDGHTIEWVADRPSIATNFGNYVGAESFEAPARFFLATSEADALAIAEERRARFVVVTRDAFRNLDTNVRIARPGRRSDYYDATGLTKLGRSTMTSGLVPHVIASSPGGQVANGLPFGRLRLLHVSPTFEPHSQDPRSGLPLRCGWIWEIVPGATIELSGAAGADWSLELDVEYAPARYRLQLRFGGQLDGHGRARVLVPYATDSPNGDGRPSGPLRWRLGDRRGSVAVPRTAIASGATLRVP